MEEGLCTFVCGGVYDPISVARLFDLMFVECRL